MTDREDSTGDGLNRRDVLRGLKGTTITAPLLLSGCSAFNSDGPSNETTGEAPDTGSPTSQSPSDQQDGEETETEDRTAVADDCGGPAGGETTITLNGTDYVVPVKGIRVPGTCEDLQAVVDQGGMNPQTSPVDYDPENPPHAIHPDDFDSWEPEERPDVIADQGSNINPAWECDERETNDGGSSDGRTVGSTSSNWLLNGMEVYGDDLSTRSLTRSAPSGARLYNEVETDHRITGTRSVEDDEVNFDPSPLNDSIELERSEAGPDSQFDFQKTISAVDVDIDFDPVIVLPDWHPSRSVSGECERRYCEKLREAFEHERGQARNALETALEFSDAFDLDSPPTVE